MISTVKILQRFAQFSIPQTRTYHERLPPEWNVGGIPYYGFTYHPRHPDHVDPPYEPTKLFLVKRLGGVWGLTPVERHAFRMFNIDGEIKQNGHIAIVKNVPESNKYLWRIKHRVEIIPIRFINGLPEDGDFSGTWLRDNGDFIVSKKLKPEPSRIAASKEYENYCKTNKIDTKYAKQYLLKKWNSAWDPDFN